MSLEEKLRNRVKVLQGELNSLDQKKRDLQVKIEELTYLLHEEKSEAKTPLLRTDLGDQENEQIKSENIRELILSVLDENPTKFFKSTQMSDVLLRMGAKSTSKNFTHLVRTSLNALRRQGKVTSKSGESNTVLYTSLKNKNLYSEGQEGNRIFTPDPLPEIKGGIVNRENRIEN